MNDCTSNYTIRGLLPLLLFRTASAIAITRPTIALLANTTASTTAVPTAMYEYSVFSLCEFSRSSQLLWDNIHSPTQTYFSQQKTISHQLCGVVTELLWQQ